MDRKSPRSTKNAPECSGYEIIDRPPSRASELSREWLRQVGAEEVFKPQEFAANRNLPIRPRGLNVPICDVLGIDLEAANVKFNRPDLQEALGFPHEHTVVAFRPLRVVSPDIEHMPSSDQRRRPPRATLLRARVAERVALMIVAINNEAKMLKLLVG